ncbi:MAG TPA: PfkB family carbohydrate kinase [Methylomirabilota bacterium]
MERGSGGGSEIHFHGGGQGFWVARMAAALGARVTLCAPLGGETGRVLHALLGAQDIELRSVETQGWNGAYVHDRRSGERVSVAETPRPELQRHEVDELYGIAVAVGLEADVTLLTGPEHEGVLDGDVYRRLAIDLRRNGRTVLADLTGTALTGALQGEIEVLKLNDEELVAEGYGGDREIEQLLVGMNALHRAGARIVVVTRGPDPLLALVDDRLLEYSGPRFTPLDARGTGDSMFAALGVGVASGLTLDDSLRLAVAAGALNATRHGLGSGHRAEIEQIAHHIEVSDLRQAQQVAAPEYLSAPHDVGD